MPVYDYVCRNCGQVVEVIHPVTGSGPSACERCGGDMRRALSAPAIVFKGSGWAKKERAASAKAGGGSSAADEGRDGTSAGSGSSDGSDARGGREAARPAGESGASEGSASERKPAS